LRGAGLRRGSAFGAPTGLVAAPFGLVFGTVAPFCEKSTFSS